MADYIPMKVLLLSCTPSSGRKALLIQYIHDRYLPDYEPTIDDVYKKGLVIKNKIYSLELLLASQNEQFQAMRELYIKSTDGIMIFYAVDTKEGVSDIPLFFEDIHRYRDDKVPIIIVGTKCDLTERQVSKEKGEEMARRLNVQYIEVSAKNNINVAECFMAMLLEIEELRKSRQPAKKKDQCIIC